MEGFEFEVSNEKLNEYAMHAKDWCLVNGLICVCNDVKSISNHEQVYPLPVTLLPGKFPKKQFDFAKEIQPYVGELVHNIANDHDFLKESLADVIKTDEFTRNLWEIYETVRSKGVSQPISMNILRNDFMLDKNKKDLDVWLSNIEINTVAVSFGASTTQINKFHKNLMYYTENPKFVQSHIENDNVTVLANGIIEAWKLYGNNNFSAVVAFIVGDRERNIGDQTLLENRCYDLEPKIRIKRITLSQIHKNATLKEGRLIYNDEYEIGLAYFRTGYTPEDFKGKDEWSARLLIERSSAIKSPSVKFQLVGTKRIQQVLTDPEILLRFAKKKEIADKLASTFVAQYSFDKENFEERVRFMLDNCENFVLKPQREGGGHNIYKSDIRKFYEDLKDKTELYGFILMQLVDPFTSQNYIIKTNKTSYEKETLISELGIYSVLISNDKNIVLNQTGGYLVRTKPAHVNEGGVATGFAALDSLYLV